MATSEISIQSVLSDALFKQLDDALEDLRTNAIASHGKPWSQVSIALKVGYVSGVLGTSFIIGIIDAASFNLLSDINREWMSYGMGFSGGESA